VKEHCIGGHNTTRATGDVNTRANTPRKVQDREQIRCKEIFGTWRKGIKDEPLISSAREARLG